MKRAESISSVNQKRRDAFWREVLLPWLEQWEIRTYGRIRTSRERQLPRTIKVLAMLFKSPKAPAKLFRRMQGPNRKNGEVKK